MLRKLKRSVARAKMNRMGLERLNRKRFAGAGKPVKSFFADNWRRYLKMPVVHETKRTQDARKAREEKRLQRNRKRA